MNPSALWIFITSAGMGLIAAGLLGIVRMNMQPNHLTLSDVLADAGSRLVPWIYVTTCEGEEIERQTLGTISIRQHSKRASVYSRLGYEFEYGDDDEITAAVTINEIAGIDR